MASSPTPTLRVLVIDDEKNILTTLSMCLEGRGCTVATATTEQAALQALRRQPFDLAFLRALNPYYGGLYFLHNRFQGFIALGAVVLCVTGCEAHYADMGHFGPRPTRAAWHALVLPASLISYYAQGAWRLHAKELTGSPFFQIVPGGLLYPMGFIATRATLVASQSLISGAFSLTRQAAGHLLPGREVLGPGGGLRARGDGDPGADLRPLCPGREASLGMESAACR